MPKAIAYFKNGLGNFVCMMPALQALRDMTGNPVDICLDAGWQDSRRPAIELICKSWDIVGNIVNYPKQTINHKIYDLWFYSNHNTGSDATPIFQEYSRIPMVGRPSWRDSLMHEEDHYMAIAHSLGYRGVMPEVEFPLADNPILELPRPIVGICNGAFSTEIWEKKRWPHYQRLVEVMQLYLGVSAVGVGADNELQDISCDLNYAGKLDILETAKTISQCDLFISTDTGNMHIADVLKVPIISLFGATLISKNAPRRRRDTTVIMSDAECAPCQDTTRFRKCEGEYICMKNIAVGDVVAVIKAKLKKEEIKNAA